MQISLFNFILPLHTKPLWMNKWKYAWTVPFFSHFNEKMFFLFLFFRRLLPTQNLPQTSADPYTSTPQKKKKKENTKKKDINKETSQ